MAKRLADGPSSLGLIRKMYWASVENTFEQQLALEAVLQKTAGMSEDHNEGVTAFREKRRPRFTGR